MCFGHAMTFSVINHTRQDETSHSPSRTGNCIPHAMMADVADTLRVRLKQAMEDRGLSASQLSMRAGLNRRAVKDIEEGRAIAPKISTVFALAEALNVPPSYLLGISDIPTDLERQFLALLRQYDEDGQARLLEALRALAPRT